jgi:small subunit ribosomal protein S9
LQLHAQEPLAAVEQQDGFDVKINVDGGGNTGQAGAVRLAVARALLSFDPELRGTLREHGMLTRDSREVERKKPGQPGARKRFQFSKR